MCFIPNCSDVSKEAVTKSTSESSRMHVNRHLSFTLGEEWTIDDEIRQFLDCMPSQNKE